MTIHPPNNGLGWFANWGMTATTRDSDFVHILAVKLHTNVDPVNMYSWEINPTPFDLTVFFKTLTHEPNLIIFCLGENVSNVKTFGPALDDLLKFINLNMPRSQILVTGTFWTNNPVNDELIDFAKRHSLKFVSLGALETVANISFIGAKTMGEDGLVHEVIDAGVAAHPGDAGMRGIADAILANLPLPKKLE